VGTVLEEEQVPFYYRACKDECLI